MFWNLMISRIRALSFLIWKRFFATKNDSFFVFIIVIGICVMENRVDMISLYVIVFESCIVQECHNFIFHESISQHGLTYFLDLITRIYQANMKRDCSFKIILYLTVPRKYLYLVHVIFAWNRYKFRTLPNIEQE